MSDDAPRRIPLAELVERLAEEQRLHYEQVLADCVRQIEELPEGFDATKRALIEEVRARLAAHLDEFVHKLAALAGRGMRVDEPLH